MFFRYFYTKLLNFSLHSIDINGFKVSFLFCFLKLLISSLPECRQLKLSLYCNMKLLYFCFNFNLDLMVLIVYKRLFVYISFSFSAFLASISGKESLEREGKNIGLPEHLFSVLSYYCNTVGSYSLYYNLQPIVRLRSFRSLSFR